MHVTRRPSIMCISKQVIIKNITIHSFHPLSRFTLVTLSAFFRFPFQASLFLVLCFTFFRLDDLNI